MSASLPDDAIRGFGFLLKDVSRLYSRNFERRCASIGLTLEQCRALGHLQRHPGVSQARLAELCDSDPMTLGRLLQRLEAEGLVERRPDPRDGRAHSLTLRPAAARVLDAIWQHADEARAEALAGLGAIERRALVAALQRVRENLDTLLPGVADASVGAVPAARLVSARRAPRRAA